jgi:hypothetical protein
VWRVLQLLGAGCLVVVVLTHVSEALRLFPSMQWGSPTSVGHYLDLSSAVLGLALVAVGYVGASLVATALRGEHPADVAAALRDLEPDEALAVFGQIDDARAAEVLDELDPELTRYGADGAVASRRPSR